MTARQMLQAGAAPNGARLPAACLAAVMALPLSAQEQGGALLLEGPVAGDAARYDQASGRCSAGAEQLLEAADLRRLAGTWSTPAARPGCTAGARRQAPGTAGYPRWFAELGISGSAQVLVMLEADGTVADVHAVCASGRPFAEAAVRTARVLEYVPATCDGRPVRSSFLLPFQYDAPPPPPQQLRTAGLPR